MNTSFIIVSASHVVNIFLTNRVPTLFAEDTPCTVLAEKRNEMVGKHFS